jgi:hypothetical protein
MSFAGANNGFARLQWSYQSDSNNILEPSVDANPQIVNEAFNMGDISFGLQADTWEASIFMSNITDERAQYTHQSGTFIDAWGRTERYTSRPREIGVRFSKHLGD